MTDKPVPRQRQRRHDGELSRARILDAATEIAASRGYDGTSIGAVSAKCGLPASSIYWHFKDKDDLIAAVIERSFTNWLKTWRPPESGPPRERLAAMTSQTAKGFLDSPDFIRLGLMLMLERRPVEPRARTMFLRIRDRARNELLTNLADLAPGLTPAQINQLTTYAMAGADGLFIAKEIGGDSVDLLALFELHGQSVYDAALRMLADGGGR